MDIAGRVQRMEKRLVELETRIARLERLMARHLNDAVTRGKDQGFDRELLELRKLLATDEDVPPPGKRH